MVDREKVLHGLNSCGYCDGIPNVCGVTECPYESDKPWCTHYLARDAGELIGELLKAQEPVKPILDETGVFYCANCKKQPVGYKSFARDIFRHNLFCPKCGREVKWDD